MCIIRRTSISRLAAWAALFLLAIPVGIQLTGCTSGEPAPAQAPSSEPKKTKIHFIGGNKEPSRRGDVIFLHGLDGDYRGTWENGDTKFFWPNELSKDFPDIAVWSIDYHSAPSDWLGKTMPLTDRSKNLLEQMRLNGLGKKPTIFVGHSLGGLVIKQMLRDALTQNQTEWQGFATKTKGVMFLATPHTGSTKATLLNLLNYYVPDVSSTISVTELEANNAPLRDLNVWYRGNIPDKKIQTGVLYENEPVVRLQKPKLSLMIVDECSSDPGVNKIIPTRVDANHLSIARPESKEDIVYKSTADFIKRFLVADPKPFVISFSQLVDEFNTLRNDSLLLKQFKSDHVGQEVKLNAFVRGIVPGVEDKQLPAYWIAPTIDTRMEDQIFAIFEPQDIEESIPVGTEIEITGVIKDTTNLTHIFLHECKIIRRSPPEEKVGEKNEQPARSCCGGSGK